MSIDFDDIDKSAKATAKQGAAEGSLAFNPEPRTKGDKLEVVARHAISGLEIRVVVPKNARFKHVKQALANARKSNEIMTRGQLMSKRGGIYTAFKDQARVGDVKEVLVVCTDLGEEQFHAELNESDISDGEEPAPAPISSSAAATAMAAEKRTVTPAGPGAKAGGAAKAAGAQEKVVPGVFTKSRAIALQKELLEGFKSDDFQEELKDLKEEETSGELEPLEFQKQRQQLFLTVQAEILPKYGFEGTQVGVFKMMGQMGPFLKDPEFSRLNDEINEVIGLTAPKEGWDTLSKSCVKLAKSLGTQDKANAKQPKNAQAMPTPFLNGRSGAGAVGMPQARALGVTKPAAKAAVPPGGGAAAKQPPPKGPKGPPAPPAQAGAEKLQTLEGVPFDPFPSGKRAPYKLFAAGSWNDYKPKEMAWESEGGLFSTEVTIGKEGWEAFQLLKNGKWETAHYPTIPDASPFEEHGVLGPDKKGHGLNWQIGKFAEDQAAPGATFLIVAVLDKAARVMVVEWEKVA